MEVVTCLLGPTWDLLLRKHSLIWTWGIDNNPTFRPGLQKTIVKDVLFRVGDVCVKGGYTVISESRRIVTWKV